jgi:hypothetical protein
VKYSIDTSAILDGWVRYYPPDRFPSVWRNMEGLIASGDLRASEEVLVELKKKDDDVCKWAKSQAGLFVPIDDPVQEIVKKILSDFPGLVDAKKNRSAADPFVVGVASVNSLTVVSGESPSNNLAKPKIPDVCSAIGIKHIRLLELFAAEGWKF